METNFRCGAQRISGLTREMKREPSCSGEQQRTSRCSRARSSVARGRNRVANRSVKYFVAFLSGIEVIVMTHPRCLGDRQQSAQGSAAFGCACSVRSPSSPCCWACRPKRTARGTPGAAPCRTHGLTRPEHSPPSKTRVGGGRCKHSRPHSAFTCGPCETRLAAVAST